MSLFIILKKAKLIRNYFLIALLYCSLYGCVSYSKKEFRKEYIKLNEHTLHMLNGKFKLYPIKRFQKETSTDNCIRYTNLYQNIVDENWNSERKADSLCTHNNTYSVALTFKDNKNLRIKLIENTTIIRDTTLSGKYKNGMFYLDNKDISIHGIPFLFGGYRSDKRRIGMTKDNNLIVNEAIGNEGAILLILAAGYQYNASYEYERIQ
ncbi:hypothetical protein ACFSTE_16265 [Aquimarina hainanensis]|uniref:Lipoprotein n=1 Tax=Aquimarina hainanensis TaxID=1578017 RepID=A0ABW5NDA0_9FLAO